MEKRDYYEILGVSRNASQEEIEQAYRKLLIQYHPDRFPPEKKAEAREKFKEVSEAYGVLSDPNKRAQYDRFGHAGISGTYTTEDIFRGIDFESIFEDLGFGTSFFEDFFDFDIFGTRRKRKTRRGSDIETSISLSLEEVYRGTEKPIQFSHLISCSSCRGTGAEGGRAKITCPKCGGRGRITRSSSFFFSFSFTETCPKCRGEGEVIEKACRECGGKGLKQTISRISLKIPPGTNSGTTFKLSGKGDAGKNGGPPGDLYVTAYVQEHPVFKRDGDDLYMKVEVPFSVMCLGGEIPITTLDGKIKVKIPPGTPSGKTFRIRKKGMPNLYSRRRGDLLIKAEISVPTKLNSQQKSLLIELSKKSEGKI